MEQYNEIKKDKNLLPAHHMILLANNQNNL